MAKKTEFNLFFDDVIAPGPDIKTSPVVPSGERVLIREFGGSDPGIGDNIDSVIALQWGSAGSWETLRAGTRHFNFRVTKPVLGDGFKRFRLVRQNNSVISKRVIAWANLIIDDK